MERPLLLYDADCGLCVRLARFAPRRRWAVDIAALQSVDLAALGVSPDRARRELPLVDPHGTVRYGHEAVAGAMSTGGPGWRAVGRILTTWPISVAAHGVYGFVSRNRHRLPGGTRRCRIGNSPRRG